MKSKKAVVTFGMFIIICVVVYLLAGFFPYTDIIARKSTVKIPLYFLNPVTNKLEIEERAIQEELFREDKKLIESVLAELMLGPKNSYLTRTIPKEVIINKGRLVDEGDICELELSNEYNDLSAIEELFCRASLVWTLTSVDFINNVHIYVEGQELLKLNNQPMGLLNRSNVVIDASIPINNDIKTVTLYFEDENHNALISENRLIEVNPNQMEEYVIKQLILGPKATGHFPTIPVETKIREIKIDEGVCYVDLSSEFINKQIGGRPTGNLAIYSIVNSLCELSNISKVQILVDSEKIVPEKVTNFKGDIDISVPIVPNKNIISE